MAGGLTIELTTGLTLKAMILGPDRSQRWDGSAMVAISSIADADWATGMVAMSEEVTSDATATRNYVGTFPTGIVTEGEYVIRFYSGASPTPGQSGLGQQTMWWDGSASVSPEDKTGYSLAATGLDLVLVDGKTLPATLQIIAAGVLGEVSGAGSGTEVFVGLDGATTRATVTVDASGNRTGVVYG